MEKKKRGMQKKYSWKKLNSSANRNFILGLKYAYNSKGYILFALITFIAFVLIGFCFPVFFNNQIISMVDQLINQTENLSGPALIGFIFMNNIRSSFLGVLSGIFLGVIPFMVLVINGYVLGFVANKTVALEGLGILWRLLPHGIFELPAVFISAGLGMKIGVSMVSNSVYFYSKKASKSYSYLLIALSLIMFPITFFIVLALTLESKELRKKFAYKIIDSLRAFVFVVIPLLIIAAIIEGSLIRLLG